MRCWNHCQWRNSRLTKCMKMKDRRSRSIALFDFYHTFHFNWNHFILDSQSKLRNHPALFLPFHFLSSSTHCYNKSLSQLSLRASHSQKSYFSKLHFNANCRPCRWLLRVDSRWLRWLFCISIVYIFWFICSSAWVYLFLIMSNHQWFCDCLKWMKDDSNMKNIISLTHCLHSSKLSRFPFFTCLLWFLPARCCRRSTRKPPGPTLNSPQSQSTMMPSDSII